MTEFNEYQMHVSSLYDDWLYKTEKRSASYGELAYIYNLKKKELEELEAELIKELEELEGVKDGKN